MKPIDVDFARQHFKYNRKTGLLTRLIQRGACHVGSIVGYTQTDRTGHACVKTSVCGKGYLVHRIIWLMETGEWPDEIDHINGVPTDNRWVNLRSVSRSGNCRNTKLRKDNEIGIPGVTFWKGAKYNKSDKWYAHISDEKRRKTLYCGQDFFEACCRRKSAENKLNYHVNHGRSA